MTFVLLCLDWIGEGLQPLLKEFLMVLFKNASKMKWEIYRWISSCVSGQFKLHRLPGRKLTKCGYMQPKWVIFIGHTDWTFSHPIPIPFGYLPIPSIDIQYQCPYQSLKSWYLAAVKSEIKCALKSEWTAHLHRTKTTESREHSFEKKTTNQTYF